MRKVFLFILLSFLTSCERYVTEISTLTLSGKYKLALLDVTAVDQSLGQDSTYRPGTTYINPSLPEPFDTIQVNRFYLYLSYSEIKLGLLPPRPYDDSDLWQYNTTYQILNNNAYDLGYLRFTYFPTPVAKTLIFHIEKDGLETLQLQSSGQWVNGRFGEKQVLTFVLTRVGP